jgi:hypothetical protein
MASPSGSVVTRADWPFLWGQNEYVVSLGASYLLAVHAAIDLLRSGSLP